MRSFIGIGLPEDIRASLAALQGELDQARADIKWVEPDRLHVTLKFLGEIVETERQAVEAMLRHIAQDHAPFLLGLTGLGTFPTASSPRVIWVGLGEGKEAVIHLVERIEQAAQGISLRHAERPVAAHLTLGRVRSGRHQRKLVERLRATLWQPPLPWRVTSVTLYHSVLSPAGPQYTVLAEVPLGARAESTP